MKDFLEDKGLSGIIGPKDATRLAFQNSILIDGQVWMNMIKSRNETVHTYQASILKKEYEKIISEYFPAIEEFYHKMKTFLSGQTH